MRLNADEMARLVKDVIEKQVDKTLEPINTDFLIESLTRMMEAGTGVAYGNESGFLLGLHTEDLMTGKKKAFSYLHMCYPDRRGGNAALSLLAEFEAGAALDGCVSIVVGNSAGYRADALARLYRRLGYDQISCSFQKYL